jgi:hypothetical protein
MEEIKREFNAKDRFGADMQFELAPPNLPIETEGERYYKVAYSKALSQGIFPREKLRSVMKDHGMWTEDDDKNYKKIVATIALLHARLLKAEQAGDDKECELLATDMNKQRDKMWELFLIQQTVFMHSAEALAELIKTEAMMAACTRLRATGERYWKSYEEFVREKEENMKSTVYIEVVEVQSELLKAIRDDIEGKYPESKYLKDVRESIMDRAIQEDVEKEISRRKEEALNNDEGEEDGVLAGQATEESSEADQAEPQGSVEENPE